MLRGAQLEPASNSLEAIERETGDQYVDNLLMSSLSESGRDGLGRWSVQERVGIHFSESVEERGERKIGVNL